MEEALKCLGGLSAGKTCPICCALEDPLVQSDGEMLLVAGYHGSLIPVFIDVIGQLLVSRQLVFI